MGYIEPLGTGAEGFFVGCFSRGLRAWALLRVLFRHIDQASLSISGGALPRRSDQWRFVLHLLAVCYQGYLEGILHRLLQLPLLQLHNVAVGGAGVSESRSQRPRCRGQVEVKT